MADFLDKKTYVKQAEQVIGKLKKGNDATSNFEDYYYISVENFEIMNERGQDTVNN